jgi:hypothetical protein
MEQRDRYRLMREGGITTAFLAKRFGKTTRSIRRAIEGTVVRAPWAEECRKFVVERLEGFTYEEFWGEPPREA